MKFKKWELMLLAFLLIVMVASLLQHMWNSAGFALIAGLALLAFKFVKSK